MFMIELLDVKRKEAILNAALREFVVKGYDHASTNIIAKEAGISKALMFHYVGNKRELFFFAYDYFYDLMKKEYLEQMNNDESDFFERLRQSFLLQLNLSYTYPWILDLPKLLNPTSSDEVNKELERRRNIQIQACDLLSFEYVDLSKLRRDLDITSCKQLITFSIIGFTNQLLKDIRCSQKNTLDMDQLQRRVNAFVDALKSVYYKGE